MLVGETLKTLSLVSLACKQERERVYVCVRERREKGEERREKREERREKREERRED
jgi:hypothetical protein